LGQAFGEFIEFIDHTFRFRYSEALLTVAIKSKSRIETFEGIATFVTFFFRVTAGI